MNIVVNQLMDFSKFFNTTVNKISKDFYNKEKNISLKNISFKNILYCCLFMNGPPKK